MKGSISRNPLRRKGRVCLGAEGHTDLHPFDLEGLEETIENLKGKPVYFTVDLDVLDPSVFSGDRNAGTGWN